jgi:hypothetical protein
MERSFCHNVHVTPEDLFQVENQPGWKPGTRRGADVNQQIKVTLGRGLATGHRPKHAEIICTMRRRNALDGLTLVVK